VKHNSRISALLAAALAVGIAAAGAGCGGGSSNTTTKPVPKANQNQINPQSRDKVKQGGKFTWAIDGAPSNFNYNEIDGTELNAKDITWAMLPQPFTFDATATPILNKDYVLSTDVKTDPQQVITYELNPKAVWYDGTPVSAADYIAQWKACNGTNKAYLISGSQGYDQIASVTQGKDQFEVIVTFAQKFADWQSLFLPLYPASTDSDPNVFNTGWKDKPLTSAGPFKLDSVDATAKTYTLVPNEKWWGVKPKLDSIVYRVLDDDAQPDALANGEIDAQNVGPNVDYYNRDKAISGVDIRYAGGPNFRHITINSQSPELQDVNVRTALAKAIDRDAIAKAEIGPLGVPAKALNNHLYMSNQVGYVDNSGDAGKFDPAKSKEMLDAAGWKVQGNQRVKDGKPLAINFVIPAGVATSKSEAELVQNMLQQVNVAVNINTVPSDDFFDKYVTPGQFDFTVFSWIGTQFPISSNESIYQKPKGDDIKQNYARVGSDQIDALFHQADQELDRTKAIDDANQADKLIWQEVHSLTTYQRPDLWAVKSGLANFGALGFASITYQDIGWVTGS
jgi:peptide/nickel transport system substrate-binding protein